MSLATIISSLSISAILLGVLASNQIALAEDDPRADCWLISKGPQSLQIAENIKNRHRALVTHVERYLQEESLLTDPSIREYRELDHWIDEVCDQGAALFEIEGVSDTLRFDVATATGFFPTRQSAIWDVENGSDASNEWVVDLNIDGVFDIWVFRFDRAAEFELKAVNKIE